MTHKGRLYWNKHLNFNVQGRRGVSFKFKDWCLAFYLWYFLWHFHKGFLKNVKLGDICVMKKVELVLTWSLLAFASRTKLQMIQQCQGGANKQKGIGIYLNNSLAQTIRLTYFLTFYKVYEIDKTKHCENLGRFLLSQNVLTGFLRFLDTLQLLLFIGKLTWLLMYLRPEHPAPYQHISLALNAYMETHFSVLPPLLCISPLTFSASAPHCICLSCFPKDEGSQQALSLSPAHDS